MNSSPAVYWQDSNDSCAEVLLYQRLSCAEGELLAAASSRGLCQLAFLDTVVEGEGASVLAQWRGRWPGARWQPGVLPWSWQDAPLHVRGTVFQRQVWAALLSIPAGQTLSYGELARRMGQPRAARAVGQAVGANPLAMRVPCHRVIRSDGSLGDYHWGAHIKQRLLALECAPIKTVTV